MNMISSYVSSAVSFLAPKTKVTPAPSERTSFTTATIDRNALIASYQEAKAKYEDAVKKHHATLEKDNTAQGERKSTFTIIRMVRQVLPRRKPISYYWKQRLQRYEEYKKSGVELAQLADFKAYHDKESGIINFKAINTALNKVTSSTKAIQLGTIKLPLESTIELGAIARNEIDQEDAKYMSGASTTHSEMGDEDQEVESRSLEHLLQILKTDTQNGTWRVDGEGDQCSLSYTSTEPKEDSPSVLFDRVKEAINSIAGGNLEMQRAIATSIHPNNSMVTLTKIKAEPGKIVTFDNTLKKNCLVNGIPSNPITDITLKRGTGSTLIVTGTYHLDQLYTFTEANQGFTALETDSITRTIKEASDASVNITCTAASMHHKITDLTDITE